MDNQPDDLSELERRLTACRPASQGLDADAMLFAAGRAAAPRRLLWPALTGFFAVLALALGVWGTAERAERLALGRQLGRPSDAIPEPAPPPAESPEPQRSADEWLTARRALEQGLEAWPPRPFDTTATPGLPSDAAVLTVGRRDVLLDP